MRSLVHLGLTAGLLSVADLAGLDITPGVAVATVIGGVFLDGDKTLEIYRKMRKPNEIPDITARCRILHSILAWPFGLTLSFFTGSWLPFLSVLIHIGVDSFIPGLIEDNRSYPSHSPQKWVANPFSKKSWSKVSLGWQIIYPPKMNWIYRKLCPTIGGLLLTLSAFYWLIRGV